MKSLFLIGILLSAPSYAADLSKLLTQQNIDAVSAIATQIAQAPKDRSCEALLNPEKRLQLWQLDQKLMQLMLSQNTSALTDIQKINLAKLFSLGVSLRHLIDKSQQCVTKPLDWDNICSNNPPTLADQCNEKIDLKYWVSQDWQCADNNEQCIQKLPQLQSTQQASRQLAEWALDNANTIYPTMDRSKLKLFLGLNPQ